MCQYCQENGEHGLSTDFVRHYIEGLKKRMNETGDEEMADEIQRAEKLLHTLEAHAGEA